MLPAVGGVLPSKLVINAVCLTNSDLMFTVMNHLYISKFNAYASYSHSCEIKGHLNIYGTNRLNEHVGKFKQTE